MRPFYFFPLRLVFILGFFVFLIVLFVLVQVEIISYVYERIGISAVAISPLLLVSLLGSAINIPDTRIHSGPMYTEQIIDVFGMRYVMPAFETQEDTIIAINVGGAIVPTCISLGGAIPSNAGEQTLSYEMLNQQNFFATRSRQSITWIALPLYEGDGPSHCNPATSVRCF